MLKFENDLLIVSDQLKKLLFLIIVDFEHFIGLFFDLFLKIHIVIGGGHEGNSHIFGKDNIHNVNLFDDDSVLDEFSLEILFQTMGELSFDISDIRCFRSFYKVSDAFLALLLKQLLKSIWAEIIEKFLDIVLLLFFLLNLFIFGLSRFIFATTNMEIDAYIKRDHNVIFSWDIFNWTLKSNSVF